MISHFEDAIADAKACPRMWSVHDAGDGTLVGFAMISDDIPQATLDADDGHRRAVLPVAAADRPPVPGPRLRPGDDRRGRRLRPDAARTATSSSRAARPATGSPQPFYLRYGFSDTDRVADGEDVLGLELRPDANGGGA